MLKYLNNIYSTMVVYLKKSLLGILFKRLAISVGGLKGWLVSYIFNKVWEFTINPILKYLKRKLNLFILKRKNKKKIDALKKARGKNEILDKFNDLP